MHLAVYPPDGRVHISVPMGFSIEKVRMYILQKWIWIEEKRISVLEYNRQAVRIFVSGEAHYFKGELYRLKIVNTKNEIQRAEIQGDYIVLFVRENANLSHKQSVLNEWYRDNLRSILEKFVDKWEKILHVKLTCWEIRLMSAHWGTCSKQKKKAIFNLELAKKPLAYIEYVVAHELTHLIERTHSDRFKRILDIYLPDWIEIKKKLNEFPV